MTPGSGRGRRRTDRGQSETIGVVLLLAITVVGTTAIVGLGATALDSAKLTSQRQEAGHAMTQFDSRAAIVALGDSKVQEFSLGNSGDGYYRVDEDVGWVNITHRNRTGEETETITNRTLGAVIYESRDTVIAYQGGGVWQGVGANSTMLSPPEFHYRSATLTFPLIRVRGDGSAAGPVSGRITLEEQAYRIFPDASDSYETGTNTAPYLNPIENGTVEIKIHSAYYQAWGAYFRSRSTGDVTEYHGNDTVVLELTAIGTLGDFEMPAEGNAIELRGLGDAHPLTDFNITLYADDQDNADFSNLKWSLYAEKGGQEFELHIRNTGGRPNCGDTAQVTVYYSNDSTHYQAWKNETAFQYRCESNANTDFNGDGDKDDRRLDVNFTGDTPLEYGAISQSDLEYFSPGGMEFVDPTTFNEHKDSISWESDTTDFSTTDETSVNDATNHYVSFLAPSVELRVYDKSSNTVNEEQSEGTLEQKGGAGKYLTFLHVTENEIEIEFE